MTATQNHKGLQFQRRFTKEGVSPFDMFEYDYRTSIIRNPSGEVVFEMTNVEVPKRWSQIATDIIAPNPPAIGHAVSYLFCRGFSSKSSIGLWHTEIGRAHV